MRKRVTVAGRSLSYLEAGSGSPLLLIHGFPVHADMWEPQLADAPDGWRVIAPDLRGFGPDAAAPPGGGASVDDYAGDVLAVMEGLGLDRAVIGGLSMGGYVVFALFRQAPQRFRGLVLADTRPQADTDEGRAGRRTMREVLAREGVAGVEREMLPKLVGESTRRAKPDVVERLRAMIVVNKPPGVDAAIVALMNRPDSTPQLAAIRCPALVIVGAEDALTPPADSERMHRAIAGSRLAVVPGAGHMANLEAPEAFNQALARFLRESF